MNSIEDVLTAMLFKYAGPPTTWYSGGHKTSIKLAMDSDAPLSIVCRPDGVLGFIGRCYRDRNPEQAEDFVDFIDSPPSYYAPDPAHPWRAEIRAELVELFDLIFEKPMTELLFMADPSGGELERELKHLRRNDP